MNADLPKESVSLKTPVEGDFRISGTGWLCVWHRTGWIAVFKLTEDQMREYTQWRQS